MKNNLSKLKRKGITTKVVRQFLADSEWRKDEEASEFLKENVYRYPDGRVFYTFLNGRGCLYETEQDFVQFIEDIKQLKMMKPTHILKDRLLYGADFIQHVPELVDQLAGLLKIPNDKLDKSMDSLLVVQAKIKHLGRTKCIEAPIFAGLVAYIGEVMIAQITDSRWQMHLSDQFPDTREPWIIDPQGRTCNSWSYLYDMLAEPSEGISLQGATGSAIQFRHVPQTHTHSPTLIGSFISKPQE